MYESRAIIFFNNKSNTIFKELESCINKYMITINIDNSSYDEPDEEYYYGLRLNKDVFKLVDHRNRINIVIPNLKIIKDFLKDFWNVYKSVLYKYNTTSAIDKHDMLYIYDSESIGLTGCIFYNCFLKNIHYQSKEIILEFTCDYIRNNYKVLTEENDEETIYTLYDNSKISSCTSYTIYVKKDAYSSINEKQDNETNNKLLYIKTNKEGDKVEKAYECYINPYPNIKNCLPQIKEKEFILEWGNSININNETNNKQIIKFDKKPIEE